MAPMDKARFARSQEVFGLNGCVNRGVAASSSSVMIFWSRSSARAGSNWAIGMGGLGGVDPRVWTSHSAEVDRELDRGRVLLANNPLRVDTAPAGAVRGVVVRTERVDEEEDAVGSCPDEPGRDEDEWRS